MSRTIPVFEREQRKTYELQRGNPRRRMLNKHWKQDRNAGNMLSKKDI